MGNWWSFVGQAFDFTGFVILAVDLLRDYGRHATRVGIRRNLREYHDATVQLAQLPTNSADPETLDLVRNSFNTQIMISTALLRVGYEKLTGDLSAPPMADVLRAVQEHLDLPLPEVTRRPPVRVGIVLVVTGFALQMIGSWPG